MRRNFLIGLAIVLFCLFFYPALPPSAQAPSAVAEGYGGAVASADRNATQIGIHILKSGGNAIDAAVATAAALGVSEPFSGGIGGGDFMMIYLKAQDRVIVLDGREEAPASAFVEMFKDPDHPDGKPLPFFPNRVSNGAAVGVPGTPLTWAEALHRYGTLDLKEVLRPAIDLAERGFTVDAAFVNQIKQNQTRFSAFTSTRALYLPNGKPPKIGSRFKNPEMAKTYRLLATQGVNAFYRGELGQAIVKTVQNPPTIATPPFRVIPGGMTLTDLDRYEVRVRSPLTTTYRGHKIYSMGLPSSGGTTTHEVLNIVASFDLAKLDRAKAWHTIIEAERLAFADRNQFIGDSEFVDVPLAGLMSPGFAQTRRTLIGDRAPNPEFRAVAGNPLPFQDDPSPSMTGAVPIVQIQEDQDGSTTHLTVADRFGNIVSYTLTLEFTGGSGMVVPGYGFILNNELTDFDPVRPHPNSPEPGKRPRSSMAPMIVFAPNGQVSAFGAPGGSTIITTVLGITLNTIDFRLSLAEAISAPRISQRNGGVTQVDGGLEKQSLGQQLTALGHQLQPVSELGAATGVIITPQGRMIAAAEPARRGGGTAMTVR
ncbi:MAG: gamma-glutamyltransferase [Leptolyngbyaceae cyanobacterium bins.59]|nr:gamma-glutamyltransferase [Leptolyngbyaceae cyanobacterium bins.59]